MSVYVDDMEAEFGRMKMCHMWADTYPELIAMAQHIGVDVRWIQHPPKASWVHFDIALSKRALAVQAGAIEKTMREAVAWGWRTQCVEPSYAAFYPGFLEGYAAAGDPIPANMNDLGRYWYRGWTYAWDELGLKSPDDDIPF